MLTLEVPIIELYDDKNSSFINIPAHTLKLEHSLVSISKWEAKFHKPFLSNKELSGDLLIEYIRFMTITQNVRDDLFENLPQDLVNKVIDYIQDPMTATTFSDRTNKPSREIITSEIIYFWMVNFNIPIECQKWHLNRLLALIKVCIIKTSKQPRMSRKDILSRNAALNAERKARLNTSG